MLRTLSHKRTSTSLSTTKSSHLEKYDSAVTEDMERRPIAMTFALNRKTFVNTETCHGKQETMMKSNTLTCQNKQPNRMNGYQHKASKEPILGADDAQSTSSAVSQVLKNNQLKTTKSYDASRIVVCVRKRPLNKRERLKNEADVVQAIDNTVQVYETKQKVDLTKYTQVHPFTFDITFGEHSTNADIYKRCAKPLVQAFFEGKKLTCFAYGQTGAGKTHTMMGTPDEPGLYNLALQDIFFINNKDNMHILKKQVECREDAKKRVCIIGLEERLCQYPEEVAKSIEEGEKCRSTGTTGANSDSSRSHAILEMQLLPADAPQDIDPSSIYGKLSFIDLAGSERAADTTHNNRQTRMEGAEINKSLLALKECIRALGQNHSHTPFRGSKLTLVLKDSFVSPNSRTVMIANVSPSASNCEHTLNTLRYADRVKELKKDISKSSASCTLQNKPPQTTERRTRTELTRNSSTSTKIETPNPSRQKHSNAILAMNGYTGRNSKMATSSTSSHTTMDSIRSLTDSKRTISDSSTKSDKDSPFHFNNEQGEESTETEMTHSRQSTSANIQSEGGEMPTKMTKFGFLSSRTKSEHNSTSSGSLKGVVKKLGSVAREPRSNTNVDTKQQEMPTHEGISNMKDTILLIHRQQLMK
eukprot:jgi/Galph1/455/GphlegSOOS_G5198.1